MTTESKAERQARQARERAKLSARYWAEIESRPGSATFKRIVGKLPFLRSKNRETRRASGNYGSRDYANPSLGRHRTGRPEYHTPASSPLSVVEDPGKPVGKSLWTPEKYSKEELQEACRLHGLKFNTKTTKAQLAELLNQ